MKRPQRTEAAEQSKNTDGGLVPSALDYYNSQYPFLEIRPLAGDLRALVGDPDPEISLRYYDRFSSAVNRGDDPAPVLQEFLKRHLIEFASSGWVLKAVGWICLGYPDAKTGQASARKWFDSYWRFALSPKHSKSFDLFLKVHDICGLPHRSHWRKAVIWLRIQEDWPFIKPAKLIAKYKATHPKRCPCLSDRILSVLCEETTRAEGVSPSTIVLSAIAKICGVSSRTVSRHFYRRRRTPKPAS